VTIADVYRALWRHRLFIVLLTALLVAAAWFVTSRQTPQYEASTLVRVQQRVTESGGGPTVVEDSQELAQTYAQIIESGALRGRLDRAVPGALADATVTTSPVENLGLVWVTARSSSPEAAAAVANAVPAALTSFIRNTGTLRDLIVTIRPASVPTSPVSPSYTLNIALALFLGLIFNCALALFLEVLSDRLPESDKLEAATNRAVLATIPVLSFSRSKSPADDAVEAARHDRASRGSPSSGELTGPRTREARGSERERPRRGSGLG
jgi:succinoglycan biosynthesis transport protein ExoP